MRRQQRFHLAQQPTSPPQARLRNAERTGRHLERRMIQRSILAVPSGSLHRLSSRNSQARARLQSRRTVATETPRTCAASSRIEPTEKAQLDHMALTRVHLFQCLQRIVERQKVDAATAGTLLRFRQRDVNLARARASRALASALRRRGRGA